MLPQLGAGGCWPSPRNDRLASAITAAAIASVACTISRAVTSSSGMSGRARTARGDEGFDARLDDGAVELAGRLQAAGQAGDERLVALQAHLVEAAQLGERLGMGVDTQVELRIVLVRMDAQRGGLPAPLCAAGRPAGQHAGD